MALCFAVAVRCAVLCRAMQGSKCGAVTAMQIVHAPFTSCRVEDRQMRCESNGSARPMPILDRSRRCLGLDP
eukprot:6176028-Pleurochrysis_carterae.AAC.3